MVSLIKRIIPPPQWRLPVIILAGIFLGTGLFIMKESNVTAYLSDDPRACINCHVMTPEYITWDHSSHRKVASCNDCHVPHDHVFNTYYFKAKDGLYHASIFTMRMEPQTITMRPPSVEVVQQNCIRCHENQVTDSKLSSIIPSHQEDRWGRTCWECHQETPHGSVKSLSAVGFNIEPLPLQKRQKVFVPDWIKEELNSKDK